MNAHRQRIDALLLSQATEGLTSPEGRELENLLANTPGVDRNCYEQAAAIVCLAICDCSRPLPRRLRAALTASAQAVLGRG
jgi:hypothetical protein